MNEWEKLFYKWITTFQIDSSNIILFPNSHEGLKFLYNYTTKIENYENADIYIIEGSDNFIFANDIKVILKESDIPSIEFEKFLMANI